MVVAPSGDVFVSDMYNDLEEGAYRAFSSTGLPLTPWRTEPTSYTWNNLAADAGGNLYALDGQRFWKASPNGHMTSWLLP